MKLFGTIFAAILAAGAVIWAGFEIHVKREREAQYVPQKTVATVVTNIPEVPKESVWVFGRHVVGHVNGRNDRSIEVTVTQTVMNGTPSAFSISLSAAGSKASLSTTEAGNCLTAIDRVLSGRDAELTSLHYKSVMIAVHPAVTISSSDQDLAISIDGALVILSPSAVDTFKWLLTQAIEEVGRRDESAIR
jgi:hypothetical protein